jgi:ubiquitin-protein ligase
MIVGKFALVYYIEGADEFGYEHISERWSSSQNVNSILMSIISLLSEPNFESPANIYIANEWQKNFNIYKKKVYNIVALSH